MQHDREAGQAVGNLLQNVQTQLRLLAGLELVSAVAGADGNRQGVNAGAGHEILHLLGIGELSLVGLDADFILNAGELAELGLDGNVILMSVLRDAAGFLNVLLIGLGGAVEHHRGKAAVDAVLADLVACAVIKMQGDRNVGIHLHSGLNELHQIGVVGVLARAGGNLQNDGSIQLLAGFGDALDDFHVVHIESADSIAAFVGLLEHFLRIYQRHGGHAPIL